jgi:hypothetical protein
LLLTRQSPASSKGGHFFTVGKNNWLIPVSNQHNHPFQLDGWMFTALHSGAEIERPETIRGCARLFSGNSECIFTIVWSLSTKAIAGESMRHKSKIHQE